MACSFPGVVFATLAMVAMLTPASASDTIVAPPYQITGSDHVIVGVVWDEAVVRQLLPAGIEPAAGMSGGINIYQAAKGYGLGAYQSAYFWVDVQNMPSAAGTRARWMLAGVYGPEPGTSLALRTYYGFPVRPGTSRHERSSGHRRAVGSVNGQDFVTVEIREKPDTCTPVAGTVSYPGRNASTGQITVNQIPYTGDHCEAEAISVAVSAPRGDPFHGLRPVKVLWAAVLKNGSFSFSRPLPLP